MRKYKCNPPKPGWYLAWFDGTELEFPEKGEHHIQNAFEWDGELWKNDDGDIVLFFDPKCPDDRWSYLPKGHPKKEKKPSRKKVALYI